MARTRRPLSPAQAIAIQQTKEARTAYRNGQAEIEERIRAQVREELSSLEMDLALKVRRCHDLDVPISTIGSEGLGTADRKTVHRWLGKTARLVRSAEHDPETVSAGLSWHPENGREQGVVRVKIEAFPTTSTFDGYPPILEGVVKIDELQPNGWAIVTDPGDKDYGERGRLPGMLTWEIEEVAKSTPGSLTSTLDAWVEENR